MYTRDKTYKDTDGKEYFYIGEITGYDTFRCVADGSLLKYIVGYKADLQEVDQQPIVGEPTEQALVVIDDRTTPEVAKVADQDAVKITRARKTVEP